jgi:hypothetical protein
VIRELRRIQARLHPRPWRRVLVLAGGILLAAGLVWLGLHGFSGKQAAGVATTPTPLAPLNGSNDQICSPVEALIA